MAREVKSMEEIKSTIKQYQTVFTYYLDNNIKIPKPRLTPTISESLIYHLLDKKILLEKLNIIKVEFSKTGGDIVVITDMGEKKIEVKSTGPKKFQQFTSKDMDAHYIIWVHFGEMLCNAEITDIDMYIIDGSDLRNKKGRLPKSLKVGLDKIKKELSIHHSRVILSELH